MTKTKFDIVVLGEYWNKSGSRVFIKKNIFKSAIWSYFFFDLKKVKTEGKQVLKTYFFALQINFFYFQFIFASFRFILVIYMLYPGCNKILYSVYCMYSISCSYPNVISYSSILYNIKIFIWKYFGSIKTDLFVDLSPQTMSYTHFKFDIHINELHRKNQCKSQYKFIGPDHIGDNVLIYPNLWDIGF